MASGQSQFLTNPTPVSPLAFNLSITDDDEHNRFTKTAEDNDTRLMEMLAAQAAHREDESVPGDEEAVLSDKSLPEGEKRRLLQKSLHMAASNGDIERVRRLVEGKAKTYIDLNGADEEGTAPLIYASCFVSNYNRLAPAISYIYRDTMKLFLHYLMQVPRLTAKIETNGLH